MLSTLYNILNFLDSKYTINLEHNYLLKKFETNGTVTSNYNYPNKGVIKFQNEYFVEVAVEGTIHGKLVLCQTSLGDLIGLLGVEQNNKKLAINIT